MTMPFDNEPIDQYFDRVIALSGANSERATPEQIESLKAQGYYVEVWPMDADPEFDIEAHNVYQWHHRASGDFQDTEPSYEEADSWALALIHSKGQ